MKLFTVLAESVSDAYCLQIEECIEEEVTVCDSAGEEEGDGISDGMATTSSELDFYLSGLNFIKQQRVPFPELGVDIVDGVLQSVCSGTVMRQF